MVLGSWRKLFFKFKLYIRRQEANLVINQALHIFAHNLTLSHFARPGFLPWNNAKSDSQLKLFRSFMNFPPRS